MAARPVVLPEPFDGQLSWGDWKLHFEDVAAVNTWSAEQKLQWLRVRLTGRAQKAFHRLPAESQTSYDAATRALQERFEPKSRMTRYQAEFESRCKKRTEGWADFAEDLRSLVDKAFPDLQPEAREHLALQSYLKQLDHPQVAFSVRQCRPATLDDAVTATLEMESYVSSPWSGVTVCIIWPRKRRCDGRSHNTRRYCKYRYDGETDRTDGEVDRARANSGAAGYSHYTRRDLLTTRLWPAPPARLNANNMLELWAAGTYCMDLPPTHAAGKRTTPGAESRPSEGVINSKAPKQLISVSPISPVGGYRLDDAINGVWVSLLVDTGASVTLLRKDAWDRVSQAASASPPLSPCLSLGLVGVDGTPLQTYGSTPVTLELNGNRLPVEVVVVSPLTSEGILGLDFLQEQGASIDLASEELRLPGQGITIPLRTPPPNSCSRVSVRAVSNIDVPARTELEVMACLDGPVQSGTWIMEDSSTNTVLVASAVVQPKSRMIPVRLVNCTSEPHTVYAGKQIALAEMVGNNACSAAQGSAEPRSTTLMQEKEEMLWTLTEHTDAELTPEQREMFYQLLASYSDVIAESPSDLGRTDWLEHSIDTGNATPIRQPVR